MNDWRIYSGNGTGPHHETVFPTAPPWRTFDDDVLNEEERHNAENFGANDTVIDMINAALYLRRPLLISGKPGSGKSSLAYSVAYELGLGQVLRWSITSSTKLIDGLYHYDAIGRLHEISSGNPSTDIGDFIRLGPLGAALVPADKPRVLLIDEIDKSDIDLPNDLLHVFEEGEFEIPELVRIAEKRDEIRVYSEKRGSAKVTVKKGRVRCKEFPFVVLTSNDERKFPSAFLRRCLRLEMTAPGKEELLRIVQNRFKLKPNELENAEKLVEDFDKKRTEAKGDIATDQLLSAIFLTINDIDQIGDIRKERVMRTVQKPLNEL